MKLLVVGRDIWSAFCLKGVAPICPLSYIPLSQGRHRDLFPVLHTCFKSVALICSLSYNLCLKSVALICALSYIPVSRASPWPVPCPTYLCLKGVPWPVPCPTYLCLKGVTLTCALSYIPLTQGRHPDLFPVLHTCLKSVALICALSYIPLPQGRDPDLFPVLHTSVSRASPRPVPCPTYLCLKSVALICALSCSSSHSYHLVQSLVSNNFNCYIRETLLHLHSFVRHRHSITWKEREREFENCLLETEEINTSQTDGWTDNWMDGRTNEWMDG